MDRCRASPVLRPGHVPGVAGAGGRGTAEQARLVVHAESHTAVGVPAKSEITSVTVPFLPQPPRGLATGRFVDSVRRSPSRVKTRLDPFHTWHVHIEYA